MGLAFAVELVAVLLALGFVVAIVELPELTPVLIALLLLGPYAYLHLTHLSEAVVQNLIAVQSVCGTQTLDALQCAPEPPLQSVVLLGYLEVTAGF